MMEELPEGQGALVQIRDQMPVDAAAPDTPTSTARAGPTISPNQRPRKDKRKRVSQGVQNKIAKAAAMAAAAADVAEAAVDAIPGRWWPRRSTYLPFRCDDGLTGPELAATHGRWKKLLVKVKATVHENERQQRLTYVLRRCPQKFHMALSCHEACISVGMTSLEADKIAALSVRAG